MTNQTGMLTTKRQEWNLMEEIPYNEIKTSGGNMKKCPFFYLGLFFIF